MMQEAAPPNPTPAATVVIFRKARSGGAPELLMIERSGAMRFAAGAAVFPGGRIDPEDRELAAAIAPDLDLEEGAARIAGVRETLEETGLALCVTRPVSADEAARARALLLAEGRLDSVLERFGWTLDLDRLVAFARWCPDRVPAFDTRFYLADLGTGAVEVAVDAVESTRLHWVSARVALQRAEAGQLRLIFPTRRNLERLAQFGGFAEAEAHARATPVRMVTPWIEERDGQQWLVIPEGLGYPVLREAAATLKRG